MPNKNQEAFEQMKRFTKAAKNFYGNNYRPGSVNPQFQTKFFLNEDYIPFDFDTDYNDPLYKEYRRVRMLKNPFEDNQTPTPNPKPMQTSVSQPQETNVKPKPKLKGFGDYLAENVADMVYGADKALSGATFGGYDWLKRKTGIGINKTDYLNMKRYNDGTDKFAKIGGTISEIGGNIIGGGRGLVNSLQRQGLQGLGLATTTGAIGGGLYGLTNSNKLNEVPYNTTFGAISGGALGGLADFGINKLSKPFMKRIFNVPQNTTKQDAYNTFVKNNASDEMLDFTPSREQINSIKPTSSYNPNKHYTKEQADSLLRSRANLEDLTIFNDNNSYLPQSVDKRLGIQHLIGDSRIPFIRTLNNTLNYPDIKFSADGREFFSKIYKNKYSNKNFIDYIVMQNKDIVSKYTTSANHLANQIKKSAQNMSLSGNVPLGYGGMTYTHLPHEITNNIPSHLVVVNPNIKNC